MLLYAIYRVIEWTMMMMVYIHGMYMLHTYIYTNIYVIKCCVLLDDDDSYDGFYTYIIYKLYNTPFSKCCQQASCLQAPIKVFFVVLETYITLHSTCLCICVAYCVLNRKKRPLNYTHIYIYVYVYIQLYPNMHTDIAKWKYTIM